MAMSVSPNLQPEEVWTIACARCARFTQLTGTEARDRFSDISAANLPFNVMAESGCKYATAAHRSAYNFSRITCDARLVAPHEMYPGLREDILGGWGFGGR